MGNPIVHGSRIGRALALASLSVLALACGGGPSQPAATDGAAERDATTPSESDAGTDAMTPSADAGTDATTPSDATVDVLDAISSDAGAPSDAGPLDGAPDPCPRPLAPDLSIIADGETLNFVASDGSPVEIAVLPGAAPIATAAFQPRSSLSLGGLSGLTRVLAKTTAAGCDANAFDAVYDVRATYAPAPPDPTTTALSYDDPRIVAWAQDCASYLPGAGATDARFMMPSQALGPAGASTLDVVTLGNGGSITLTFGAPIADGDGWDFAVYENSFATDIFLELAFVEVSSDGVHFARFDSAFRNTLQPCANCSGTAAQIGGLAGAYMVGYGTPFDLAALRNSPLVHAGTVDLGSITSVRIVDVIGDGTTSDSFGRAIIDPLSNGPTAGFDLDGIAVLNQRR
jgi:hypothetical protein